MNERLIIAGFGGQGVMTLGQLLAYAATNEDLHTLWFPSYGPETRGGTANCSVTISSQAINSPVISMPDSVIAMNLPSMHKFAPKLKKDGHLFLNVSLIEEASPRSDVCIHKVPASDIAVKLGNAKVANMVMLGAYLEVTKLFSPSVVLELLKKSFGEAKKHLIAVNEEALKAGKQSIEEARLHD